MRLYEAMFLLNDARYNENPQATTREVQNILDKNHAEVFVADKWDERKLCYPIEGRTRAVYYLARFAVPTEAIGAIERDCQLNDTILRVLIIHDEHHEKLHKAGLLSLRPGEPGEPIQSLARKAPVELPPFDGPGQYSYRDRDRDRDRDGGAPRRDGGHAGPGGAGDRGGGPAAV